LKPDRQVPQRGFVVGPTKRSWIRFIASSIVRSQGTTRSSEAPRMSPILMRPSSRWDRMVRSVKSCPASSVPARSLRLMTDVTCAIGMHIAVPSSSNSLRKASSALKPRSSGPRGPSSGRNIALPFPSLRTCGGLVVMALQKPAAATHPARTVSSEFLPAQAKARLCSAAFLTA
jgi:hypothetical protein